MRRLVRYVVIPGLPSVAVVALFLTPVSLVGCANRGLIALGFVLVALIAGIGSAGFAVWLRPRDGEQSAWWALSALILVIPALLVFGPLG